MNPKEMATEQAVLRALTIAGGNEAWVTANDIERAARGVGIDLNRTTIRNRLSRLRAEVEYRKDRNGARRFHARRHLLSDPGNPSAARFVRPGTPWTQRQELKTFLGAQAVESLLLVDPYVAETTLDILSEVKTPLRILTVRCGATGHEDSFRRAFTSFKKEHGGAVSLRILSNDALHGRYILTQGKGWVVDHSLKDLGGKPALILPLHLDAVHVEVEKYFDDLFKKGQEFK